MNEQAQKKGMSIGAKWGVGCGVGCLVVVILAVVAAIFGLRFGLGKLDEMASEMSAKGGFENTVRRQVLEIDEVITEPTIYQGQSVKILANCTTNLGIIAQIAEIHGQVKGKVYFVGQILTVQPQAELLNGLDIKGQVVQKYGKIDGEITGTYQQIIEKGVD